jgi:hypothetical protein
MGKTELAAATVVVLGLWFILKNTEWDDIIVDIPPGNAMGKKTDIFWEGVTTNSDPEYVRRTERILMTDHAKTFKNASQFFNNGWTWDKEHGVFRKSLGLHIKNGHITMTFNRVYNVEWDIAVEDRPDYTETRLSLTGASTGDTLVRSENSGFLDSLLDEITPAGDGRSPSLTYSGTMTAELSNSGVTWDMTTGDIHTLEPVSSLLSIEPAPKD